MSNSAESGPTDERSESLREELFHADTECEPGDRNLELLDGHLNIHSVVFPVSVTIIILFVGATLSFQSIAGLIGLRNSEGELMTALEAFSALQSFGTNEFYWLLILSANIAIISVVYFALSKYGNIRIGGPNAEKEFSDFEWIAMLFSAGMGIGLIVFSVSEPMYHLQTVPPFFDGGEAGTPAAGKAALVQTFYHWGLHPWGIYALVGLGLAFFSYNLGLPLTFRSIFWPVLGERIYSWPGDLIDVLSVFATLFGLATSLGLGVQQANTGIALVAQRLFGVVIPQGAWVQVALIVGITLVATGSVVAGLEKGVKRLSTINAWLMVLMLGFLLLVGPTVYLLGTFTTVFGMYVSSLVELSFFTGTLGGESGFQWLGDWTFFYWAWWIAWSPFVGMFIARISKGRTIRQFVAGVLIIPTLFGGFWMSTLGGSALFAQFNGAGILSVLNEQGQTAVIYAMLSQYPFDLLTSIMATILVISIFITSSDSGSLVVDHLSSGGVHEVPTAQRVFWALSEGAVAAVLLIGGGLTALQAASIATGVPFAVVLLMMCYAIYRGLRHEYAILQSDEFAKRTEDTTGEKAVQVSSSDDALIDDIRQDESSVSDD